MCESAVWRAFCCATLVFCWLALVAAPPPRRHAAPVENSVDNIDSDIAGLEYSNYLQQVVKYLEQDSKFQAIMANATEEEIKSGNISHRLHEVDATIRTKLDELKRLEIERLQRLSRQLHDQSSQQLSSAAAAAAAQSHAQHVDPHDPHSFGNDDLKRLIKKTSHDLAELDKQRRAGFKQHEMAERQQYEQSLKTMNDSTRTAAEHQHQLDVQHKKDKAQQLHHPLSEKQLEEVWDKQDHMDRNDFDPETFFRMHDLDGDEFLNPTEVMALFKTELDKLYVGDDFDPQEREEEMNEMRETVYDEVDTNNDGLISLQEFLDSSHHEDYKHDQGWQGVDSHTPFSEDEYQQYVRMHPPPAADQPHTTPMQHPNEIGSLQADNQHRPSAVQPNQQAHHGQNEINPGRNQQQAQMSPNQLQQGQVHTNKIQQGQMNPNQFQQGQMNPNQFQQGQMNPNQFQQGQMNPNQFQQGQMNPNQFQQGQMNPNQFQQGQVNPNQFKQGQMNPNQFQQGQMNPNQFQQGQMNPNQLQQGQVNPNQFQQGQANPNQFQQGQMNPNQFQQGQIINNQHLQRQINTNQIQQNRALPEHADQAGQVKLK